MITKIPLPQKIAENYEICDCLNETREKATYLLKSRNDRQLYILKTASPSLKESLEAEYQILCGLSHPRIPHAVLYLVHEDRGYLIREYVKDITIEQLIAENGPVCAKKAIEIAIGLCHILEYLHAQNPPIIHRDIKPQNIIIAKDGQCTLIDFGIARFFHDDSKKDTVFMGTEATAAPEQFGYMQTGVRSDVYSMGILILYLITGSFDIRQISDVKNKNIRRIITKCTRFDPADRFASVSRLRKSLLKVYSGKMMVVRIAASCSLVIGLAVISYGAALNAPAFSENPAHPGASAFAGIAEQRADAYIFASPLVEKAARQELGLKENDVITKEDLGRIGKILICGDQVYSDWDDYNISGTDSSLHGVSVSGNGSIDTLADIAMMKNITELALYNQKIRDLSPLSGLPITKLGLANNQITDLSALSRCGGITRLYLTGNPVSDISTLSELKNLQYLDLAGTSVEDISPVIGCPIVFISLISTPVQSYTPLTQLRQLEWLRASDLSAENVEICGTLTNLKDLTLHSSHIRDLTVLYALKRLSFLDLYQCELTDINGIGHFPELRGLCIAKNPVKDLSPLMSLSKLNYMNLIDIDADISPLTQLPALDTIDCSQDQEDAIRAAFGDQVIDIRVQD